MRIDFARTQEAFEAAMIGRRHEKQPPIVNVYNPMLPQERRAFTEYLRQLPSVFNVAPWEQPGVPGSVYIEALSRGYISDKFTVYLRDRYNRTRPRDDQNELELEDYVRRYNLMANTRFVAFSWKEGRDHIQILPEPEMLHELIHLSDGDIIPDKAKETFGKVRVGYAGAGVGSSALEGAVRAGVRKIVLADGGDIMYHDLNRLQAPNINSVGRNHSWHALERSYEAYPYLDAICYPKNIGDEDSDDMVSIRQFLDDVGPNGIIFEEIDNIAMKIKIREEARRRGIPVLMVTDVGMGTIVDFQPGDYKGDIFPGISRENYERLKQGEKFTIEEMTEFAIQIVGKDHASYWRDDISSGRPFWSQTGAAADASKAKGAEALVNWANGESLPSRQVFLKAA